MDAERVRWESIESADTLLNDKEKNALQIHNLTIAHGC